MKRLVLALAAVVAAVAAVRGLVSLFTSDESKIRAMVERMDEGFDRGSVRDCVGPIAATWVHEGSQATRERLANGLRARFFTQRSSRTGTFLLRVTVPEDSLQVEVDGKNARVTCVALFERQTGEEWHTTWRLRIEADLADGGDGWKVVRSRHEDIEGGRI